MRALALIFSFYGTSGTLWALITWLTCVVVQVAMVVVEDLAPGAQRYLWPPLGLATVALFTATARRLHHAGYSGRAAVLVLIPLAGLVAGLIIAFLPQRRARLHARNGARGAGYLLIALLLTLSVLRVWWTPYWISSESMKPAFLVGDYMLARTEYAGNVKRGDVAVLRDVANDTVHVKRVIAIGGDTVALIHGAVWLNGAALPQLPMGKFREVMTAQGPNALRPRCENGLVGEGAECRKSLFQETLPNGRSYGILNIETDGPADTFAQIQVPQGFFFVLGDNRDNSLDSRFVTQVGGLGLVPAAQVAGVARKVVFSASGSSMLAFWTWRRDRYFRAVQ
jgi:signal peptidase I